MVEFRDVADGFPAAEGVAVLAGEIQVPVRAAGVGGGLRTSGDAGKKHE